MTIEFCGHVKELRTGVNQTTIATVELDAERGNNQGVEIHLSRSEAQHWLPGTGVRIRMWPVPTGDSDGS